MSKLISCKSCGAQIASNAKTCPHCGAKNKRPIYKKIWFWILIVLLIGSFATGNVKSSDETNVATPSEKITESQSTVKSTFTVGETADFNGIQIKLSSSVISCGDAAFVKPDNGNLYLGMIFDINNDSSTDINISSIVCFEAYCDDYSINSDILGYQAPEWDGLNQLDGSVASGKKMNGIIVYQVPEDFKEFEIRVKPSFWSGKEATFKFTSDQCDWSSVN